MKPLIIIDLSLSEVISRQQESHMNSSSQVMEESRVLIT